MRRERAFTLIELLVVISLIALLMSIMIPTLSKVKKMASGSVCLSNQRNLIMAWLNYTVDNSNRLVGGSTYNVGSPDQQHQWCKEPMRDDGTFETDPLNMNRQTRENGIKAGKLYDYLQDVEVYHCPADKRINQTPPYNPYRTYSITGTMFGEDTQPGHNGVLAYTNITQISRPGEKYVFVEEYAANQYFNQGSWQLRIEPARADCGWWDAMAVWHSDRSSLSFGDGHCEMRKWSDKRTIQHSLGDSSSGSVQPDNDDLQYLLNGYGGIPYTKPAE